MKQTEQHLLLRVYRSLIRFKPVSFLPQIIIITRGSVTPVLSSAPGLWISDPSVVPCSRSVDQ